MYVSGLKVFLGGKYPHPLPPPTKNLVIPPPGKIPQVDLPPPNFCFPPPKVNSVLLNNNFHVIT